jgi:hypothetical protein
MRKRSHGNLISIDGMRNILAENGISVSADCIKKANAAAKLSPLEHYVSYNYLSPLLMSQNPGFKFKLEKDDSNCEFKRVAVLFPYTIQAIQHCFKVYAVDAAFLDSLEIKGLSKKILYEYISALRNVEGRIMFAKTFLSCVSGRTINNEMIIYAICIGYSECSDDYNFLFDFMKENEVKNIVY